MTAAPAFSSRLAPILERYVNLKRALGRRFADATRTLQSLDRVLHDESNRYPDSQLFEPGARPKKDSLRVLAAAGCWISIISASIATGPNHSASFQIQAHSLNAINGSIRTFSPRPKWRGYSGRLPA